MSKTGRGWAVRLLLSACVALSFSCSHGSPTEPMVSRVNLNVALVPGLFSSEENAVVVQSDTCACTRVPVTVSVNGVVAGTVACGETKSLPFSVVAAGPQTISISVQSPEINPVTAGLVFNGPGDISLRIPATLTCAPR